MDCKEFEALIDAYLDDELTRGAKEEFTAHISSCEKCKQSLAFAESVRKTLSSLPEIEVPADFTEKLNKRLAAEKKQRPFIRYTARYGALAACLILAVVLGRGISEADFSNKFDFSSEDITYGQDIAGETTPTNDKTNYTTKTDDSPKLITPRGAENSPAETPLPAKSRMAEVPQSDTEDVAALIEAYTLDEDNAIAEDLALAPVVITVTGAGGEFAKELALMAATQEDGVYTMRKEEFDNFISALETVGVEFTQSRKADEDTVKFKIAIN